MPARPRETAVGENADHEGLGLIGRVMAEQEVEDAGFAAGCGKGVIAGLAGALREGGSGSQAAEREDAAGDVPGGKALGDGCGLGGGFRADAMVDDEGEDSAAALADPGGGEEREGHAVGTARDGDGEMGRGFEGAERFEAAREFGRGDGPGRRVMLFNTRIYGGECCARRGFRTGSFVQDGDFGGPMLCNTGNLGLECCATLRCPQPPGHTSQEGGRPVSPAYRRGCSITSFLPGILVVRILLLAHFYVVLLVLHRLLAHLMLVPFMSGDAAADRAKHAMSRHMACHCSCNAAGEATDRLR